MPDPASVVITTHKEIVTKVEIEIKIEREREREREIERVVGKGCDSEFLASTRDLLPPVQETGKLAKWLVREGDYVEVGDLVCEVEVEKLNEELDLATMLIETHESGYVAR